MHGNLITDAGMAVLARCLEAGLPNCTAVDVKDNKASGPAMAAVRAVAQRTTERTKRAMLMGELKAAPETKR